MRFWGFKLTVAASSLLEKRFFNLFALFFLLNRVFANFVCASNRVINPSPCLGLSAWTERFLKGTFPNSRQQPFIKLSTFPLHFSRSTSFVSKLGNTVMSLKTTDGRDTAAAASSAMSSFSVPFFLREVKRAAPRDKIRLFHKRPFAFNRRRQ